MANEKEKEVSQEKEQLIFALEAKILLARGKSVTPEQRDAAKQYDRDLIDGYLHNCPRGQYEQISGKQLKLLNDAAGTYGLPVGSGSDVDIVEVIRWFHSWLVEWGPRIKKNQLINEESAANEKEKEKLELRRMAAQIAKLELEVARRQSDNIPIEAVRKPLSWLAGELRKLGERLGKRFGPEAQVAMNEALARIEASLADEVAAK